MTAVRRREAADLRAEWLGWAYSTLPADRPAAEAVITELYHLIGHEKPRFAWVDSPAALPSAQTPVAAPLASLMYDLRARLDKRVGRPWAEGFWVNRALDRPLWEVLRAEVRDPLRAALRDDLLSPLCQELERKTDQIWRGQHDAYWIGHYDAWRRLSGVKSYWQLDLWVTLARSCGWWWPGDGVCVAAERPVAVHVGDKGLHAEDGPAVEYADGWGVHSWHGTRVPGWVIHDPSAERISREPNVEVRRCAIERIGWEAYLDQARLRLISVAPDPGNDGSELQLYETPKGRLLLAVNGSVERDGQRRRYGLDVPGHLDDPLDAAGWTYGLSGRQYAQVMRRT